MKPNKKWTDSFGELPDKTEAVRQLYVMSSECDRLKKELDRLGGEFNEATEAALAFCRVLLGAGVLKVDVSYRTPSGILTIYKSDTGKMFPVVSKLDG